MLSLVLALLGKPESHDKAKVQGSMSFAESLTHLGLSHRRVRDERLLRIESTETAIMKLTTAIDGVIDKIRRAGPLQGGNLCVDDIASISSMFRW